MKRVALSIVLLSTLMLTACSKSETTEAPVEQSTTQQAATKPSVDNSKYNEVIAEIKSTLDPSDTGTVTIEVKNDVVDADFPEPHDVIEVNATGDSKKALEELMDAYYSNTLTPEQDTALMLFRGMISGLAKGLPKETTTISFGYEVDYNERQLVALSSKDKDLIPID